ncbi:MAG: NAD-dependent epimerase/dehydratase family protein [Xanthobacteraceae bacterium]|jgi:nucleoside-diphosphate-sugar epimerase
MQVLLGLICMKGPVAILGGTGFVGRIFVERWPVGGPAQLRLLVHRSRPDWIATSGTEIRAVDLADRDSLVDALSGCAIVINLLRPQGDDQLLGLINLLVPILAEAGVRRYIHCSSIDVYGNAAADRIDETIVPEPQTPYEREQLAAETIAQSAPIEACIVCLGAVFGAGGRNMVALAQETKHASTLKLVARRTLYGKRRMHLVSVEKVADVLRFLALSDSIRGGERILVTDDDAPENNFAFVQDGLMRAFGRPALAWVPQAPTAILRAGLRLRGRSNTNPMRRIATDKLQAMGYSSNTDFRQQLMQYIAFLKRTEKQSLP